MVGDSKGLTVGKREKRIDSWLETAEYYQLTFHKKGLRIDMILQRTGD